MVRFHVPELAHCNGHERWRVRIFLRRANGQPAGFVQWFRTRGEAWRFIEQSATDVSEVVTGP